MLCMNFVSRLLQFHILRRVVQLDVLPTECGAWSGFTRFVFCELFISYSGSFSSGQHTNDAVRSGRLPLPWAGLGCSCQSVFPVGLELRGARLWLHLAGAAMGSAGTAFPQPPPWIATSSVQDTGHGVEFLMLKQLVLCSD